jgi:hypothetical protein
MACPVSGSVREQRALTGEAGGKAEFGRGGRLTRVECQQRQIDTQPTAFGRFGQAFDRGRVDEVDREHDTGTCRLALVGVEPHDSQTPYFEAPGDRRRRPSPQRTFAPFEFDPVIGNEARARINEAQREIGFSASRRAAQ